MEMWKTLEKISAHGTITSGRKHIFTKLNLKRFEEKTIIGSVIKNEKKRIVMYAPG